MKKWNSKNVFTKFVKTNKNVYWIWLVKDLEISNIYMTILRCEAVIGLHLKTSEKERTVHGSQWFCIVVCTTLWTTKMFLIYIIQLWNDYKLFLNRTNTNPTKNRLGMHQPMWNPGERGGVQSTMGFLTQKKLLSESSGCPNNFLSETPFIFVIPILLS